MGPSHFGNARYLILTFRKSSLGDLSHFGNGSAAIVRRRPSSGRVYRNRSVVQEQLTAPRKRRSDWLGERHHVAIRLPAEPLEEVRRLADRESLSIPKATVAALDEWARLQRRKRARGSYD
jgi:hypothetical protein